MMIPPLEALTDFQKTMVMSGKAHVTRFSDSSLYDEVCILCGARDNPIRYFEYDAIEKDDCPIGMEYRKVLKGED